MGGGVHGSTGVTGSVVSRRLMQMCLLLLGGRVHFFDDGVGERARGEGRGVIGILLFVSRIHTKCSAFLSEQRAWAGAEAAIVESWGEGSVVHELGRRSDVISP